MTNRTKLDDLQLALDVAGLEPTIGTAADGANVVISLLRAAKEKETDEKKKHLLDAGISAVSMIPFADVVKLLKLRKLRKVAVKGARAIKTGAKETPKSYSLEEQMMDEGWFGNAVKGVKKAFGFGPKKRNPAVWKPKKTLSALHKDPHNAQLWIQKLEKEKAGSPTKWTAQKEKLLQQFKVEYRSYLKDMPNWVKQNLARVPMNVRTQILNQTRKLTGTAQLQKQVELLKQYSSQQTQGGDWQRSQNKWSQLGPGNTPVNEFDTELIDRPKTDDEKSEEPFKYDPSSSFGRERQFQQNQAQKERMRHLKHLPRWADYHFRHTLPRSAQREIQKELQPLRGITQLAKKIQLVKQWIDDNSQQSGWAESITKEELTAMINELVREELSGVDEGYGWVYPKDIAKDPKHTVNKTTGKNQRWTINYQSDSDIKKHGKTAKTPVNEADYHLPARVGSAFSGRASEKDPHSMKDKCPRCRGQLKYVADIGAPGSGQSWECTKCGKGFVKTGGTLIDPSRLPKNEPPPWELDPSDVMEEGLYSNQGQTPNEAVHIADLLGSMAPGESILFSTNKGVQGPMIRIQKLPASPGQPETYEVEDHKRHKQTINRESQLEKLGDIILQAKLSRYFIQADQRQYVRTPGALPISNSQISKKELKEVIKEIVDEMWTAWEGKVTEGNMSEGQPLPKEPEKIAQLIFSLKEGEYIWFSYDKEGRSSHGYGIEKKVSGDYYIYRTTGPHGQEFEEDEEIEQYAKEVAQDKYLHYYFIGPIQGYQKSRYRDRGDDDQQPGHYELYGPDPVRWQDVYENKKDK